MGLDKEIAIGLIVLVFGIMGTVCAVIEQIMYENGYVIDEYATNSITLPDLQIATIVIFLMLGVVVALVAKGR